MLAMSPSQRPFTPIELAREAGCREACALVLLYPCGSRAFTVLTLSTGNLRDHAGQVSLLVCTLDAGGGGADCAIAGERPTGDAAVDKLFDEDGGIVMDIEGGARADDSPVGRRRP